MRTGVEVADGEFLHVLEETLAQAQQGALADINHQAVVGVRADDAKQQDDTQFEQSLCQRGIFRIVDLCQRHDIIVYQGTCEQGGSQRGDARDGDAGHDGQTRELIVLQHILREPP